METIYIRVLRSKRRGNIQFRVSIGKMRIKLQTYAILEMNYLSKMNPKVWEFTI